MKNKSERKNIKKKLASILLYFLLVVVSIPIALTLLFQRPNVQTISAKLAAGILTKRLEQNVSINTISIGIFSGVVINGLNVSDQYNNTLLGVGNLKAKPVLTNFNISKIKFISAEIDSAQFNMGTYKGDTTNNLNVLLNKFSGDSESSGGSFKFFFGSIKLRNSSFNFFSQNTSYENGENTMDYANIDIRNIDADISDLVLINDSLNLKLDHLSANEKCGIIIKDLKTNFVLSSTGLYLNNSVININSSNLDLDFGMEYSNYSSLSYYVDSVNMIANIRPTIINMADIGYFADILFEMPNVVGITGKMEGPVRDMIGKELKIKFEENTRVSGEIRFTGLPDFFTTHMTGNKLKITTNSSDLGKFYLPINQKHIDLTNILPPDEQITIDGDFTGYYEDFISNLYISSNYGNINTKVKFKHSTDDEVDFDLLLTGDTISLGDITNQNNLLGDVSFDLNVSAHGDFPEDIQYKASGTLTDFDLYGYKYRRLGIFGSYYNDSVIADLRIGDKNLMMTASAKACMAGTPAFSVNSKIVSANLNKLNLWNDQDFNISTSIKANVLGTDINTLNADILLTQNNLKFGDNEYIIDNIMLTKTYDSLTNSVITLNSDVANASISGSYNILTLPESIFKLADHYYNIIPGDDSDRQIVDNYVVISLDISKPKIFSEQFLSGVLISPNTNLQSNLDFNNNEVKMDLSANKIRINNIKLNSSLLTLKSAENSLLCDLQISKITLKDSTTTDTLMFGLDNFAMSSKIGYDSIIYGINWNNETQALKNSGNISGSVIQTYDSTKISIGKAQVYLNDTLWKIDTNNLVVLHDSRIFFHNVYINAGESDFNLVGVYPKFEHDSLVARFTQWNLSNFDMITKPMNIDLNGEISGSLSYTLINENPTLSSNISILDLGLNNQYLGDANILNTWDNATNSVTIKSKIIRKGNIGEGEVFFADGFYYPSQKKDNIVIDVSFNRFKLKALEPFLNSFVTEIEGTTSGELKIRGSAQEPVITGSAEMQRTGLRILYLNTKYSFSNSIEFIKNGIKFDKLIIYDTLGNAAQISGNLTHNYFSDPKFDVDISTDGLLFFNTSRYMNDLYYGTAFASGNIKINGSPDDIDLGIKIATKKGTSVVLPLDYSVEISDKNYIVFTKPKIDSISENEIIEDIDIKEDNELKYNIAVDMKVTPIAKVGITLPDDMGTIEARGNSNLLLDVNSNGKFSLVGDYVIDNGLFHFKLGNLVSKRFELTKGGRISWSGNPYSAIVSIKGMYRVKTSLSSLGVEIDSTASYKNKAIVECYVVLTGELLNPTIKFEIKMPDLDPDLKRLVYSELDTTNTAMMNQQMISLLVLGTFSFNNASNVSLQSSYYNVIANQLSSMLSRISDNVDVGLNYKPGDNVTQEEFEVALSTQLFDDRLTIDGNFGMTYDRGDQSASNIVGDVDIGYKLTPDGQWILKVFNHSNVNSWYNYNNYDQTSPYTQGIGIAFRKEFNNIAELFESRKRDKKNKKKKTEIDNSAKKSEDENTN